MIYIYIYYTYTAIFVYYESLAEFDNIIVYIANRYGINASADTREYSLPLAVVK